MIIDLTHKIEMNMPVYPGTEAPSIIEVSSIEKDKFLEHKISLFSHTGTHIDAPAHIIGGGMTLDEFPASAFVGLGLVIDCTALTEGEELSLDTLLSYGDKLDLADFLLFNFGYDKFWGKDEYFENFPVLSLEVIDYVVKGNFKGIGSDTISLDPIGSLERHRMLFGQKEIINIENLKNLDKLGDGLFNLIALPLNFKEADGAPARVVAITD